MKKKKTGIVSIGNDIREMFEHGYSLKVSYLNHFTIRLSHEENKICYYDWFFTTGTIMRIEKIGKSFVNIRENKIFDKPEECAIYIYKQLT